MSEPHPNDCQTRFRLDPGSAEAIDRLVECGFQSSADVPLRAAQEGAALSLLALLDAPPAGGPILDASGSSLLVDVTMARVLRDAERGSAGRISRSVTGPELAAASRAALDDFVDSGWQPGARHVPGLEILEALASAVPELGHEPREARVEGVLTRIQHEIDRQGRRFRLDADPAPLQPARSGFRLADLLAVAAMLLIATGVFWPIVSSVREDARQQLCSANLGRAGMGFSLYAADHDGDLPQARASFLGGTWWDVGRQDRSHSANLYTLVRQNYASLSDLSCPGNPDAQVEQTEADAMDWRNARSVSFSFQLPSAPRPKWGGGSRLVVLTDRSPVVERARLGERFDPEASSANHDGRGQNVLFSDASVRFYVRPVLESGDNIWLPAELGPGSAPRTLTGRETPATQGDAFVGP